MLFNWQCAITCRLPHMIFFVNIVWRGTMVTHPRDWNKCSLSQVGLGAMSFYSNTIAFATMLPLKCGEIFLVAGNFIYSKSLVDVDGKKLVTLVLCSLFPDWLPLHTFICSYKIFKRHNKAIPGELRWKPILAFLYICK